MAGFLVLAGIGIPLVLLIQPVYWTAPGPGQRKGRIRVAIIGGCLTLLVIAAAVAGGILEGTQATAETDRSEFGVGYTFAFITLGFPLVAGCLANRWAAVALAGTTGQRLAQAIALGIGTGIPLFAGLNMLMMWLEDEFHP